MVATMVKKSVNPQTRLHTCGLASISDTVICVISRIVVVPNRTVALRLDQRLSVAEKNFPRSLLFPSGQFVVDISTLLGKAGEIISAGGPCTGVATAALGT